MFTGIITNLGEITNIKKATLTAKTNKDFTGKLSIGDSVSLDGVCLTVVDLAKNSFKIDVMPETRQKTNLGEVRIGDLVNLELPVTAESFLSGHIVQGHIDGTGRLKRIERKKDSHILKISIPKGFSKYIVKKGSVAVNGISLTVIEAGKDFFTVGIIPRTWSNTMLYTLNLGDLVNVEVDILAKYLERLIKK